MAGVIENYICTQGSGVQIVGTLKDAAGNTILDQYDGTEALTTQVWPGGPRPASFAPATTWIDPAASTVLVTITAAQTMLLYPGVYEGLTRLADAGDQIDALDFTLTVVHGPGGLPAVPTATTITRLVVETKLIDRDAALLLLCGKSTMADGQNRFLTDPIETSLQLMGITPEIPGVVSDADLAKLPNSQLSLLCDLAEYRLIKSLLGNFAQPDRSAGSTKTSLNAMKETFRQQMLGLEKRYAAYLDKYRATLTAGSIRVRPTSGSGSAWSSMDF
jgi:hypothetical protein